MVEGEGIRKVGGMWRVFIIFIVIYKYIKYVIKIVNFFFLYLFEKFFLEECLFNLDKFRRFFYVIIMKMVSVVVLFFYY